MTFYNSRIPITQLSYFSGGSKQSKQEDLSAIFSGNINKKLELGGRIDYLLSRGHYEHNATKDFDWQLFGSYITDRYDLQVLFNTYNFVIQENGGVIDDRQITHPDDYITTLGNLDSHSVQINLNDAYNRVKGKNYYATQRYKLGFYRTEVKDTTETEVFVPVTSFIHTIEYNDNMRRFVNNNAEEDQKYFKNTYISKNGTNDSTSYWSLRNTLGVSLLEGFNKYAKMGLAAYLTYEVRHFKLMSDPVSPDYIAQPSIPVLDLNGASFHSSLASHNYTENLLWVGAQVSKRKGKILTYNADGKLGITGPEAGSLDIKGEIQTRFPIFKDTVQLKAYGFFKNTEPAFYYKHYTSNHFIWNNDFGKIRRFRIGGEFSIPRWRTRLNVGVENIQNYVYFGPEALPLQENSIMQIFSASLEQNFKAGPLHFDNHLVYQKTSKPSVIPLPEFSFSSNLYFIFKIAKVLHVQLGVDCRYFTQYYSEAYQPGILAFHTQNETKIGNYPIMNAYANMKLKQTRFFVMYSHANQGILGNNNYFTIPHYPIPPSMLQIGISIDFVN